MTTYEQNTLNAIEKRFFGDNYYSSIDYIAIVEAVVTRALDYMKDANMKEMDYDSLIYAVNDELIYYADQWIVLRFHYFDPKEANWEKAINYFIDNCYEVIQEYLKATA